MTKCTMDDLYTIESIATEGSGKLFTVRLNADSVIYAAHFPGKPITPGACIVQMTLEMAERLTDRRMDITAIKSVKFLNVLSPTATPTVVFAITPAVEGNGNVSVKAEVRGGGTTFATLSFTCG